MRFRVPIQVLSAVGENLLQTADAPMLRSLFPSQHDRAPFSHERVRVLTLGMSEAAAAPQNCDFDDCGRLHSVRSCDRGKVLRMSIAPLQVIRAASARIPIDHGELLLCAYRNDYDDKEHLAIVSGDVEGRSGVLVRVHSECFTGDVLGSLRCDCGPQLDLALRAIVEAGVGVVVYLRQEGRGIGLVEKLKAYNLQDMGHDTVDANLLLGHAADSRRYDAAAAILADLGVRSVRLMTNNPAKIEGLQSLGVQVDERVPSHVAPHAENARYLQAKALRMRHLLGAV